MPHVCSCECCCHCRVSVGWCAPVPFASGCLRTLTHWLVKGCWCPHSSGAMASRVPGGMGRVDSWTTPTLRRCSGGTPRWTTFCPLALTGGRWMARVRACGLPHTPVPRRLYRLSRTLLVGGDLWDRDFLGLNIVFFFQKNWVVMDAHGVWW